jgi:hypothetical protein
MAANKTMHVACYMALILLTVGEKWQERDDSTRMSTDSSRGIIRSMKRKSDQNQMTASMSADLRHAAIGEHTPSVIPDSKLSLLGAKLKNSATFFQKTAVDRANFFKSEHCEAWKKKSNISQWSRSTFGDNLRLAPAQTPLKTAQQILDCFSPTANATISYIRNQKAGSKYINWAMNSVFDCYPKISLDLDGQPKSFRIVQLKLEEAGIDLAPQPDHFGFTVIRDPIQTAVAAYLEVTKRAPKVQLDLGLGPCKYINTSQQASARFMKYLLAAKDGKPLSKEFFHSYPQALKIDVTEPIDSIVKLEDISHELRSVPGYRGSMPELEEKEAQTHAKDPCANIDWEDPQLLRIFCDMYRVDYECLDYPLPAACSTI